MSTSLSAMICLDNIPANLANLYEPPGGFTVTVPPNSTSGGMVRQITITVRIVEDPALLDSTTTANWGVLDLGG